MDEELIALSKKVYEITGWNPHKGYVNWFRKIVVSNKDRYSKPIAPKYNSDYLLEKLPTKLKIMSTSYWLTLSPMDKQTWGVSYDHDDTLQYSDTFVYADTPLKALLKLTIALYDAGVKL